MRNHTDLTSPSHTAPERTAAESFLAAMMDVVCRRLNAVHEGQSPAACDAEELELRRTACASAGGNEAIPLLWLEQRLGLSPTEQRAIWILLAHELDRDVRHLIRKMNTENCVDPTLDTLRCGVYPKHTRSYVELSARGALRQLRLIERTDEDARAPEHRQTFRVSERVVALALGSAAIDPEIADFATVPADVAALHDLVVDSAAVQSLAHAMANPSGTTIVVGGMGTGRRSLITALGRSRGVDFLCIDARNLDADRAAMQLQLRACKREAKLLGLRPLICHLDTLVATPDKPERIDVVEKEFGEALFATSTQVIARRWNRAPTVIEIEHLTCDQRTALWSTAFPEASQADAELLAAMYPLAPALIAASGAAARRQTLGGELTPEHISAGVTSVLDNRLVGLATRRKVSQQASDLVLPSDQATAISELVARIRCRHTVLERWGFADKIGRGVGIAALFSGPPGTGKTMAAGLVAKELGVAIYQVEMSRIVSKWIGETERNLAQLFDAAEAGHAILLFDEADSLFGKRTEVKSSNDRFANQETNYLLQRLESFSGTCILTTNHEGAIDAAFLRRLSVHVRFEIPEVEERRLLWRAMLPDDAPVAGPLDLDSLARTFEMSGGYIKNAVVRAAYLAADTTGVIDAALLAHAAHLEYESMGKIALAH